MTDSNPFPDDAAVSEETSKAEIAQATDIMLTMVKAAKGARMYQSNNPLLGRFYQELAEKMATHLQLYGGYKLDVDRFELRYKGQVVYANQDATESIAFRMYSDGIRSFIFNEGVEDQEVRDFLTIVTMSSSADLDDDIVTRLWDRELPHCVYILEDDFQEVDRSIEAEHFGTADQGGLPPSLLADPLSCAAALQSVPPRFYTLSEDDLAAQQILIDNVENIRPLEELGRILSAILAGVAEPEIFSPVLEICLKLVRNLFASGESEYALKLFGVVYARTTQKESLAERRQVVLQELEQFWTENAFKGLCTNLNTSEAISATELKTLARMLCRTSIATLCELLGMAEKMSTRKVLIEVLMDAARDNPQILIPHLADSRWYLVRNMVFILTHLQCGALLESMAPLISHRDQRVRKEVLKYLITVAEPKAKTYMLKFLRDDSSALRVMAIQYFRKEKLKFALKPIVAFIDSYEFENTDMTEKKTVYEAIGELGGETMLPVFKSLLLKKYLLTTPKEMESVVCALAGLQKVPGQEALRILEEGLRAKRAEFRDVIRQSIRLITAAMAAPPRG